ncbi:winged helix-turn-helix domain-containing protein, partial [Planomonospora algeriensis]
MSSMLPAGWRRPGAFLADSLAEALREAVLDGRIRVGDRLPAERRMAAELGVSRGTVTAALARLRTEGWLDTRHGSASTMRLPPQVGERFAPLSADRPGALLDLRRAPGAARPPGRAAGRRRRVGLHGPPGRSGPLAPAHRDVGRRARPPGRLPRARAAPRLGLLRRRDARQPAAAAVHGRG